MVDIYSSIQENYIISQKKNESYRSNNTHYFKNSDNSLTTILLIPPSIIIMQPRKDVFNPSEGGLEDKLSGARSAETDEKGREIMSIYKDLMGSNEGKEYVKHLQKNGNGAKRPGVIDDFYVINKGKGLVAATTPGSSRKQIFLNLDFIDTYAKAMSKASGLSYKQSIELILMHEINHNDYQTKAERSGHEKDTEYHNDMSLIQFYTGLAKKDIANSDTYLAKAKMFSVRYDGKHRENMDDVIMNAEKTMPQVAAKTYNIPFADYSLSYRNAA